MRLCAGSKYIAVEACQAIYRSFCRLDGYPGVLVIDQDAVFVANETYGEVIKARMFEDFYTEQELSGGYATKWIPKVMVPIENLVGFVKRTFFPDKLLTEQMYQLPDYDYVHQGLRMVVNVNEFFYHLTF